MDPTATTPTIRRSLLSHAPVRAKPRDVLARLHDYVDADTPPHGPDSPVELLERRIAELLGKESRALLPDRQHGPAGRAADAREAAGRSGFAAHPYNHLDVWEQKGYNAVHGLWLQPVGDLNS